MHEVLHTTLATDQRVSSFLTLLFCRVCVIVSHYFWSFFCLFLGHVDQSITHSSSKVHFPSISVSGTVRTAWSALETTFVLPPFVYTLGTSTLTTWSISISFFMDGTFGLPWLLQSAHPTSCSSCECRLHASRKSVPQTGCGIRTRSMLPLPDWHHQQIFQQ